MNTGVSVMDGSEHGISGLVVGVNEVRTCTGYAEFLLIPSCLTFALALQRLTWTKYTEG